MTTRQATFNNRKCYLFTLIELLVVISIVSLLISILLPALQQARQAARGITCLTQQRQLTTAALSYGSDHHDYLYPHEYRVLDSAGNLTAISWSTRRRWWCQTHPPRASAAPPSGLGSRPTKETAHSFSRSWPSGSGTGFTCSRRSS